MGQNIKLGVFLMGPGHHIASWRHPDVQADASEDFLHYQEIAKIAESGKLDMLFLSDGLSFNGLSHPAELVRFEPFTLLAALSVVTTHIGLAATATTTYNEPFHIARKFASLDHLSHGRSAWNVVTSYYQTEASNFNQQSHLSHGLRYDRAKEFVEVVKGLWDSWEEDALVRDKASGVYFDPDKLHALHHQGNYFSVKGPLNASRTPQGRPVIIQAGSSEEGINLAAQTADVIFTAQQTLEEAQAFYKKVKEKVIEYGRSPDDVKIMPGLSPFVGHTEQEAREKYQKLQELIVPEVGLDLLSEYLGGFDLSGYPLDQPLPENIPETNGNRSRRELLINLARREKLTIRELYKHVAGSRGHRIIYGDPEGIADQLEEWVANKGADGFNLMLPSFPNSLADFVELVIPVLQQRGLFRTEYEGKTLRENLGLPEPKARYDKWQIRV
ncbi:LLM class flavin-dependent oxidoreductase [Peribacillus huizhouensis]|uniref:FMN-dependent oxidoreductase (Nitrilotriacetate monooxygenase family) n=1 Tax=Peribacillus huizhouensis TaxID=1501239 RepID=A0ABR6CMH0_9BACI|nr:LLM class flavin-dependent oxidoreductase [Peribacillus huizhouensis]MBA9025926.1 FMN-dependent oxidoreductase (nitrilotriacetate monooxygenase family) [Peribacillus huizhouensis]